MPVYNYYDNLEAGTHQNWNNSLEEEQK